METRKNTALYQKLDDKLNQEFHSFCAISDYVFHHPELGGEEYESSAYLCKYLEEKGFQVSHPCQALPTAFVATYRPQKCAKQPLHIAFIAEYDALPGFGKDGGPGHACGHNWIAASMCGCAVTLAAVSDQLGCQVQVIGTPAEETFGGKYDMIQDGIFENVDFAFQAHLDEFNSIETLALAMNSIEFTFHGVAAHAAQNPERGVNALDAVIQMFNSVNAYRQHMGKDCLIHGIITAGGTAANTVPDFAQCKFGMRAKTKGQLRKLREQVIRIAEASELATGAKLEYRDYENPTDDMINVFSFADVCRKHLEDLGYENFTPEDKYPGSGSSDIGNVSYVCPTVYMEIAPKEGNPVIVHDQSAMLIVNTAATLQTMKDVIKAYTCAAVDICLDPALQDKIKSDYNEKRKRYLE